jgi:hypothetical protein
MGSDLLMVTYPMFKAALLAASATWDAHLSYACASRNGTVSVPINIAPGVPAFRIDSATLAPLDPTFPATSFRIPWIAYLSAERADGLTLAREILTERTPDGGLLMNATTERLDPMNPEHLRRAHYCRGSDRLHRRFRVVNCCLQICHEIRCPPLVVSFNQFERIG